MSSPHRVLFRSQLNDPTTTLDSFNCNPTCGAMALDRQTLGRTRVYGGQVRTMTGDKLGGTTITQIQAALVKGWDQLLDTRMGERIGWMWDGLRDGRGVSLSGSSSATKGTRWQASTTFAGNHQWYINEGRGWRLVNGAWLPDEVLVYDPLANGRLQGSTRIIQSPFWLPRLYVERFAARLNLGSRLLGTGRVYAMLSRDTEPHVHLAHGGKATSPFPDRTRAYVRDRSRRVNVRSAPTTSAAIVDRLAYAELFIAYQRTETGQSLDGSRVWYGDHDGKQWVHESGLRYRGGST